MIRDLLDSAWYERAATIARFVSAFCMCIQPNPLWECNTATLWYVLAALGANFGHKAVLFLLTQR